MPIIPFDKKKIESSILGCFTYDLTTFFFDKYIEVESEETNSTIMIVYEKILPWLEFEIFDTVQFRVFFDKDAITGSNPINVKLISSKKEQDISDAKNIAQKIQDIYGADNLGENEWTNEDSIKFREKNFRRIWTIENGESFVSIEHNEKYGINLNILFFNNLIEAYNTRNIL